MSAPVASTSTSRPTFFGLFDRSATPVQETDIEAQLASPLAPPSPARIHTLRAVRASIEETTDAVDDFFGAPRRATSTTTMTGTRESRHDEIRLSTHTDGSASETLPPPYECSIEPPAYSRVADQPTLAMYLFKFGFLFPLFWLAGALILLSPLRAPSDWEAAKPDIERAELIESMRRTEVKWARRCLVALVVFALAMAAVALCAILVART
ncbi:hypothetical protein L226DRAFT_501321 [Lentinus tigrinus ALCF2SS1-7]|uniref:Transmembrane protein n=1 Tax=Lentinus tigrinus ALCF2SS1-6 TaxID=1328759 RepID=A0A5C2SPV8_9APHY|nr:hypothetical protein L227DRAFT_518739 [Lentinus tigrinus ALCF2SS1-6]RPD78914.1 hypothetical protein L226DRAFT_501321 [Lentinus tigrinus ALCF2SS1-7]